MGKQYVIPSPILNLKEEQSIEFLNQRYEKLCTPKVAAKLGQKASKVIPSSVKELAKNIMNTISEQELYEKTMAVISGSFKQLEEIAAKQAIPKKTILKRINKTTEENDITKSDEICLARSYNIAAIVNNLKTENIVISLVEGAGTGALGVLGLPFNLVLITFICYRAVQTVAMCYGYDVKSDPSELIIASDVFMNALSPSTSNADEISSTIAKIMTIAEVQTLKEASKKTYAEMASKGGLSLLTVQLRALANNAAKKALEATGKKGLENSLFKGIYEQLGKNLSKKTIGRIAPGVSAIIGAAFDIAQMQTVVDFADVFYNKRFIMEKERRIDQLVGRPVVIDVEYSYVADSIDGDKKAEKTQE